MVAWMGSVINQNLVTRARHRSGSAINPSNIIRWYRPIRSDIDQHPSVAAAMAKRRN
jgi:hypothetical protein